MNDKGPDITLIIAILAASLIIGGAIIYTQTGRGPGGGAPGGIAGKTRSLAEQIMVPDKMRACQKGDRCIVVDSTCSFCCKYVPINATYEQVFNQIFDESCKAYKGETCNCFDLNSYPACVDGECQMVKFDETARKKPRAPAQPQKQAQPQTRTQSQKSSLPRTNGSVRPDAQLRPGGVPGLGKPAAAPAAVRGLEDEPEQIPFPQLPPDARPSPAPKAFPMMPRDETAEPGSPSPDSFGEGKTAAPPQPSE